MGLLRVSAWEMIILRSLTFSKFYAITPKTNPSVEMYPSVLRGGFWDPHEPSEKFSYCCGKCDKLNQLAAYLGCRISHLPLTYLGLPLGSTFKKKDT